MRILWITAVTIIVDQLAKIAVVKYMFPGQSIPVLGDWLRLTFTTNPGMAFGISFGPPGLVTILSLLATGLIIAYMFTIRGGYGPYIASLGLILGGALGNIIDRMFYGVIYGHGALFTGEVVDFIHFNIWRGYLPDQIPLIGGNYVALFPIWNVADMAIVIGVVGILMFQNRFHEERARSTGIPEEGLLGDRIPVPELGDTEEVTVDGDSKPEGRAVVYTPSQQNPVLDNRDRGA